MNTYMVSMANLKDLSTGKKSSAKGSEQSDKTVEKSRQQTFGELIKQYKPPPLQKESFQPNRKANSSDLTKENAESEADKTADKTVNAIAVNAIAAGAATSLARTVSVSSNPQGIRYRAASIPLSGPHPISDRTGFVNRTAVNGSRARIEPQGVPANGVSKEITLSSAGHEPLFKGPKEVPWLIAAQDKPLENNYPSRSGSANHQEMTPEEIQGQVPSQPIEAVKPVPMTVADLKARQAGQHTSDSQTQETNPTTKGVPYSLPRNTSPAIAGETASIPAQKDAMVETFPLGIRSDHKAVVVDSSFHDVGGKGSVPANAGMNSVDMTAMPAISHNANVASNSVNAGAINSSQMTNVVDLAQAITSHTKGIDGTYTLEIAMHPSELGEVKAQMSLKENVLTVVLTPNTPLGHHALSETLTAVKSQLAQNGTEVNVMLQNHENSKQQRETTKLFHEEGNASVQMPEEVAQTTLAPSGRVHVIM